LETIPLENGFALSLYDSSRKVAGDRWLVSVTARMDIPVNQATPCLNGPERIDSGAIQAALGGEVVFEKTMDRNFISHDDKVRLFYEFRDSLVESILKYVSRPDFPKKYVLKCYRAYQQKQGWYSS
jgi:hypothetical protein